ncbi:MAG: DoxX family protein [Phycisphaerales bacterium]
MTPSQFAATNILPLLARVVLCLAFLPQGWNNLMRDVEYTGKDAQRLRELGVRGITDPDPKQADVALGAVRGTDAWTQDEPAKPAAAAEATPSAPAAKPAPAPAAATTAEPAPAPAAAPARRPLAPLTQRGLYTLALLVDRAQLPFSVEIAWAAAGVQLLGGACALLGMFTRVWGFLMSVMLAALFLITALPGIRASGLFSMSAEQQNLVFAQLGLLVMSLGLFLIGPGAMSLDRAIFRKTRSKPKSA